MSNLHDWTSFAPFAMAKNLIANGPVTCSAIYLVRSVRCSARTTSETPPGGGGGTSICMHIGYVPRERPPFSALNFRSGAYHFHKSENPFRSITILNFLADFAVTGTIIFKISLISTRSSPPTAPGGGGGGYSRCKAYGGVPL